jgi:predicted nucleic acid-binding protein
VTLVDANIIMYAAGRTHPHKSPSAAFLEKVAAGQVAAVIDVETLQEILHRYHSVDRLAEGLAVYDRARLTFPEPLPITGAVTDLARELLDRYAQLSARDAVHAAAAEVYGISEICSFDRHFDGIHGLRRMEPS